MSGQWGQICKSQRYFRKQNFPKNKNFILQKYLSKAQVLSERQISGRQIAEIKSPALKCRYYSQANHRNQHLKMDINSFPKPRSTS